MWRPAACALLLIAPAADAGNSVVAFADGYDGWQQWDWNAITHLAFWPAPDSDVRAHAKANGVKLFGATSNLGPEDWTDGNKVADSANQIKQQLDEKDLDGTFTDYEGNGLSDEQKQAYTAYIKAINKAIAPKEIFVCVGGRPTYEWRNYDYPGLAAASSFLFIMGYDMHFWDDYTCVAKGTCSPAEAPLADLKAGVAEYLESVPADKLVLGLPWYGQVYSQVLGVPINYGQVDPRDWWPILYGDQHDRYKSNTFYDNEKDYAWKLMCNGACLDSKKGNVIWFDDERSLQKKYDLASDNALLGVGIWELHKLDYSGQFDERVKSMWGTLGNWSRGAATVASALV